MIDLGDTATMEFLHSGCALLVCTASADGRPQAARAWGLRIVDAEARLLRLLVEAADHVTVANIRGGGGVSVTATRVLTFRSMQLKGRGLGVDPPTPEDMATRDQYTVDFIRDVHEANQYPVEVMQRWADRPVLAAHIQVDSAYDQTPGPSAGLAIDEGVV